MVTTIYIALRSFLMLTLLTGVAYPLLVTGIGQTLFQSKANGSLIEQDGRIIGSELIAQKFASDRYFWTRPSAVDFATIPSGASNAAPTSEAFRKMVAERQEKLVAAHGAKPPADLLLASGSGLDSDISVEAAMYQLERVAKARGFDQDAKIKLTTLIEDTAQRPQWGFLGTTRVNVLDLNMKLDGTFR